MGCHQARAAGALLRAHDLLPALVVHTNKLRTRQTLDCALGEHRAPRLQVRSGPGSVHKLLEALSAWCDKAGIPLYAGPILLCAHNTTQSCIGKHLGLPIPQDDRALVVIDIDPGDLGLVRAWSCLAETANWQPVSAVL
jgi:hypothetical protein